MKIFCVSGGKYKSFYLNAFLKIKNYDLIVINFGIMYDLLTEADKDTVVNELLLLQEKAKVPIIAGVKVGEKRTRKLVFCDEKGYSLHSIKQGVKIKIRNKTFVIGNRFSEYRTYNKIVLGENRINVNPRQCSYGKIYIFCDSFGITKVEKRKISRKFYKYAKIILK